MSELVLYYGRRTALGKFGGGFKYHSPMDLASALFIEIQKELDLPLNEINEVILGQCRQTGHGPNPARTAAVRASIPTEVPATTINMACPSGMIAIRLAQSLYSGKQNSLVVVGGMDSMSTIPYLLKNVRFDAFKMGNKVLEDGWSDSIDPLINMSMGQTAENIVERYQFKREDLDDYALLSHQRASLAQGQHFFEKEIIEVYGLATDEAIRHSSDKAKMASLPAVFKKNGTVSAGNSCAMADGAAMMLMADRQRWPNQAAFRIKDIVVTAVEPEYMGIGPGVVIKEIIKRNGLSKNDIQLCEINEAFASQILANLQDLNWSTDDINRWGGAIALGHPTGMSGARLVVTLMSQMQMYDKNLAIAAICGAGGVSSAMLIERIR